MPLSMVTMVVGFIAPSRGFEALPSVSRRLSTLRLCHLVVGSRLVRIGVGWVRVGPTGLWLAWSGPCEKRMQEGGPVAE